VLGGVPPGEGLADDDPDLYVSINLPPSFWQPTAMRHVLATIETFGLAPIGS
jgi:hypothetical protein